MTPVPVMNTHSRARRRFPVEWVSATAVAALLGVGGGKYLRATEVPSASAPSSDAALVHALGAPSGVLAVVNPVNCSLTAKDAAVLNAVAAVPGMRVTVLLLAVPAHDSILQRVRSDFGFSPDVVVSAATSVDPRSLPELFRTPFIALLVRGALRHAAWGESLKSLPTWLPRLTATPVAASVGAEP